MALNQNQFAQTPVQGMMDLEGFGSNVIAAQVASDVAVSLIPGQAVIVENTASGIPEVRAMTSNSEVASGFIAYNLKDLAYPALARLELAIGGSVMYMTSSGTIARWGAVEVDYSTNRIKASSGTNPVIGWAYDQAKASGQLIRVYVSNPQEVATSIASVSGLQAALNNLQAPVLPYEVSTTISTVGAGTLTAAAIVGKLINRTGPVAAYSDTTDTAVNIVAALNTYVVNSSFEIKIKNRVNFPQTILAGVGVTLVGQVVIPGLCVGTYLVTITSPTAVTLTHVQTTVGLAAASQKSITPLTTVGAGTITAAGIASGITSRSGSVAAFTDTTDTAAAIIAAIPNAQTGQSYEYTYYNNTGFGATIAAGASVTMSGLAATFIPAATWARYLVTITGATTVTIAGIATGSTSAELAAQFATGTTTTTFAAGQLTGANFVTYTNTQATPDSIATRTAAQMIADIGNATIGQSWVVRIVNGQGTGTLTVTAGASVTLTGTATVAINTWREFLCTVTSIASNTITMQNIGTGTFS